MYLYTISFFKCSRTICAQPHANVPAMLQHILDLSSFKFSHDTKKRGMLCHKCGCCWLWNVAGMLLECFGMLLRLMAEHASLKLL